jgi:hypothetical protein
MISSPPLLCFFFFDRFMSGKLIQKHVYMFSTFVVLEIESFWVARSYFFEGSFRRDAHTSHRCDHTAIPLRACFSSEGSTWPTLRTRYLGWIVARVARACPTGLGIQHAPNIGYFRLGSP